MLCSLSNLGDEELQEIRRLEQELGKTLLSFSCHPLEPAEIEDRELSRIKSLEQRLGVALVAVD
jgi:hypothetical protein